MQKAALKTLSHNYYISSLQVSTKEYYRVSQLHEDTIYSQIRSIDVEIKGLRKVGQG